MLQSQTLLSTPRGTTEKPFAWIGGGSPRHRLVATCPAQLCFVGRLLGLSRAESPLLLSAVSLKHVNPHSTSGETQGRLALGSSPNGSATWRERNTDFKNYFLEKVRNQRPESAGTLPLPLTG